MAVFMYPYTKFPPTFFTAWVYPTYYPLHLKQEKLDSLKTEYCLLHQYGPCIFNL